MVHIYIYIIYIYKYVFYDDLPIKNIVSFRSQSLKSWKNHPRGYPEKNDLRSCTVALAQRIEVLTQKNMVVPPEKYDTLW